jgi:hypothetical protein
MAKMSVKEWAAAYRALNEAERKMLEHDLPLLSPQESILRYFRLCEFVAHLSPDARDAFEEEYSRHYLALEERLRKAAQKLGHDFPD